MGRQEVSLEDYTRILDRHKDEVHQIELLGWQIPILHGLIALAADHPCIKELGKPTQDVIRQTRYWCRERFSEWGFSAEEVEYLDTMREGASSPRKWRAGRLLVAWLVS